jgi:hypothetical protein
VRENRNTYRVLVGKRVGKGQFGRSRDRWEGNIKLDLKEMVWGGHRLDSSGSG